MKANDMIKVHMYMDGNREHAEIQTRNFDKVFKVYEKNGKLGIDWNTEHSAYTCKGDVFVPFESFAQTVIFENVETSELYNFDNISKSVVKAADICIKSIPCCGCVNYETCTKNKK